MKLPFPREGVGIALAIARLSELSHAARNVSSVDSNRRRDAYLIWTENAEVQLRSLFDSTSVWLELFTDRYWHIRSMTRETPRPAPLVRHEAEFQADRLQEIADYLQGLEQLFAFGNHAAIVVPDSNVLVHFRRFTEIPWHRLAGGDSALLVIPMVVVDELDDLKYRSAGIGDRAAGVIKDIRQLRSGLKPEVPVEVRQGVSLQLLVDAPGHVRVANRDEEILRQAGLLQASVGDRITIATNDYGMQVRAVGRGLKYLQLPDDLRLPLHRER